MYLAGYIVAGFLVAAAYAWRWLRGERSRYVRTALVIPLTIAALAAPVQVVVGDWIARRVAEDQPLKLAAFEGLGETTAGAPVHVGGWYHDGKVRWGVEIPKLLSLLAHHDPDATVHGLERRARGRPPSRQRRAGRLPAHGRDRVRAPGARPLAPDLGGGVGGGCRPRPGSSARSSPPRRSRWWR